MIQTECKGCGQKLKLADDMAGKRARCPSCGDPVKVPAVSVSGSSPERPRAATPPPERPRPALPAPRRPAPAAGVAPAPPSSANPFDFLNPAPPPAPPPISPSPVAPVAQLAPPANVALVFTEPAPALAASIPRRGRSLARQLASCGALVGAVVAVALLMLLGPSDEKINEALGRLARGKVTVDHVRGGLVGLIGGLLVGSAVVAVVGRSLSSVMVGCLAVIAGAVFGAIRHAGQSELPLFLLLAAAIAGVVVGAALGGLLGAVAGLARE